jgi:hypothetical protein
LQTLPLWGSAAAARGAADQARFAEIGEFSRG